MKASDLALAERHRYKLLSGVMGINVTTVTGMLDGGKSAGMAWRARQFALEGKNHTEEWDAAAMLGTYVHDACEKWLRGEDADCTPRVEPYLDSLEAFFADHTIEPIEVERVVLSHHGYGGRFDFIACIGGVNVLVDVKTGKPYGLEHSMQLAAYRYADGMAVYGVDGSLVRLDPLPPIERAGCLYLSPEGYEFVMYPAGIEAFRLFRSLLVSHKRIQRVKELLK